MHPKPLSTKKTIILEMEALRGVEKSTISLEYETPGFDETLSKVDTFENIVNKENLNLRDGDT